MEILTNAVPQWISIIFLLIIPIPVFMIAQAAKLGAIQSGYDKQKINWVYRSILIFYGIYFIYVLLMSYSGVLSQNTLPPKILLFATLPLLVFLFLVVSNLKIYKTILENSKLESLVNIHLFRLIGAFFIITNAYGAIPTKFAYTAGIGDIVTALSSIFVAKAIANKKTYAKYLTIGWNIFGMLDIILVITTAIITTKLSIETGLQGIIEFTRIPFCLIPAFAPATILFLHFGIFKKLRNFQR